MQHHSVNQSLADEGIAPAVARCDLLRPPQVQIQRKCRLASVAHPLHGVLRLPLERHHHQDVGIGIPAGLAAGLGAKKDHLLRSEVLHQALRESLQSLAGHKGGGIGGHGVGWPVPAFAGRGVCLRLACTFNPTVESNLTLLRVDPLMRDDPAMMR
jgi:hypothetical protein